MKLKPEEILKQAREKKKYTQQDLADKLGITLRQYHKYESGVFPKYKSDNIKHIDTLLGTNLFEQIYEQFGQSISQVSEDPIEYVVGNPLFKELTAEIKQLKATVYILKVTVAQLAATSSKKEIGSVLAEMDQAIKESANSLFDEDKKNQAGV